MARSKPDSACCSRCASTVGDGVKVQPTTVDGEKFCPRCFVWWRMASEPSRFNASQACVVKCQHCEWTAISFGGRPGGGGLRCSNCGQGGAQRIRIEADMLSNLEREAIRDALHG
jgi:hypothetical protein